MVGRLWIVLVVVVLAIAGVVALNRPKSAAVSGASTGASTTATLNVLPTTVSITVSPGQATFGDCGGGGKGDRSTPTLLGYPNGECSVGTLGANGTFPITIDNTGVPSNIEVSTSSAVPADSGTPWLPCSARGRHCTGPGGKPGVRQYEAWTAARGQADATQLTADWACDFAFDASSGCSAARGQFRKEGIKLIGPTSFGDPATSWTVTVTWIAVPP
jgi:hypothetical protein